MTDRIKPLDEWTTEDFDKWARDVAHRIRPQKLYTAVFGSKRDRDFLRMTSRHSDALLRYTRKLAAQCKGLPSDSDLLPRHKPLRRVVLALNGHFDTAIDLLEAATYEGLLRAATQ